MVEKVKKVKVSKKKPKKADIAAALRSLGLMISAGVGEVGPVLEQTEQYKNTRIGQAFQDILSQLDEGIDFNTAFASQKIFPQVAKDLVDVGSSVGTVGQNLVIASELITDGDDLQQKIRLTLMQPIFLISMVLGLLFMVTGLVLPQFKNVFVLLDKPLPPLTSFVMQLSNYLQIILIGLVGSIIVGLSWWFIFGRRSEKLRTRIDKVKITAPLIGSTLQVQAVSRFFRMLDGVYRAGLQGTAALEAVKGSSGNRAIAKHIDSHVELMLDGQADFPGFAESVFFPRTAKFLIQSHQDVGQLAKGISHVSEVYIKEAKIKTDMLASALDPVVNIATALLFVVIGALCYLPVLEMYSSLGSVY